MRTTMASLLRRTLRFSRSSPNLLQPFSSSSSSSSSSLLRRISPTNLSSKPLSLFRFASTAPSSAITKIHPDERLKLAIDSEIDSALQEEGHDQEVLSPEGFPFEILDKPGERVVILKRKYRGESIRIEAIMNDTPVEEDKDSGDESKDSEDDEEEEMSGQNEVSLIVSVEKGEGTTLEFNCAVTASQINIYGMALKGSEGAASTDVSYQGPEFSDLDEGMQKAFYNYLEKRGVDNSLTNFLQDYMINKDSREYVNWLKNMQGFIGK